MKFKFDRHGGTSVYRDSDPCVIAFQSADDPGKVHVYTDSPNEPGTAINLSPEDALKFARALVIAAEAAASTAIPA